ncbi:hypothetical protein P7K49_004620 [Saguinus oedipus]|uniref:Uncharacterized protein n=1 Tax=Saguinus oedipus TaxID=9490 RepID=A0ABQ9W7Z2_SAGOE|nr:hypothetical protein P7K49_004620 [Saguinus oedipus]
MSEILCQWLNKELKVSRTVRRMTEGLAGGGSRSPAHSGKVAGGRELRRAGCRWSRQHPTVSNSARQYLSKNQKLALVVTIDSAGYLSGWIFPTLVKEE